MPDGFDLRGTIKIGDSGFSTDCGYDKVMSEAEAAARRAGADVVRIIRMRTPNMGSSCYRIEAELYRSTDPAAFTMLQDDIAKSLSSSLPAGTTYALVHFYRPKNFGGSFVGYNVHDGEKEIGRIRNNSKISYQVDDPGQRTFWARTEAREELNLVVEAGKEYFVRCSVAMGIAVGRPRLELVSAALGREEIEEVKD